MYSLFIGVFKTQERELKCGKAKENSEMVCYLVTQSFLKTGDFMGGVAGLFISLCGWHVFMGDGCL